MSTRNVPKRSKKLDIEKPPPSSRLDKFSGAAWVHEHPSRMPLVQRSPTLDGVRRPPNSTSPDKKPREMVSGRAQFYSHSSSSSSSDSDSDSGKPGHVNVALPFNNITFTHENPNDNTIHFSLDVADDIESHLEEVSRLKRWGYFNEAIKYFMANLEHHLDLPLVALQYSDLLLEQGSYQEWSGSSMNWRWDDGKKMKCLPIGGDQHGPNLYQLHSDVLRLKSKLFCTGFSVEDLNRLQIYTFFEYMDKRVASRHEADSTHGIVIPFDSTEVQIICNQLLIGSEIESQAETDRFSAVSTRCWPLLYNDLLMDGRIWELSDLLLAMFRFFGFRGTLERLFDQKKEKESRKSQIIHCLERLLKDWSIDEYDESTELAILTILVAMLYTLNNGQSSSMLPQDRNLNLARCVQQANQCAADIKAHSPHLAKSRPYLQWLLAKEHFNGQGNPNILFSERWEIQFLRFPGLALERNSLPSYIPLAIENPGWPVPDPKFSPSENLQWALEASKELLDYRTQAMLLKEIICRVEDPRLSFEELDKLSGLVQGDLVQLYESCLSQYLLTTDKISCQELLKRLRSIASQFQTAPDDDVCVATHWEGLMVQNALAKLVFENAELIGENARLAQKICKNLPFSQTIIDKFSQSISADEGPPSDGWMQRADILKLRQRNRDLERELHDMKLRREFNSFEDAERPKAGEEDNCKKLLGKTSNSCRGRLNDAPSGAPDSSPNQEPTLAENTEPKSRKMDEKGQSENKATEDLNPMTNEPDNIDCDTHIGEEKKPQALEKPHNFATVTNAHDEPTRFAKPSQYPANLCQYEKRTHLKSRAETAQPSGTFESDQLALEKNIGEESGSSRPASPAPSSG